MFLSVYSAYDVIAICLKKYVHVYIAYLEKLTFSYNKVIFILCFNPTLYYGMLIFIGI